MTALRTQLLDEIAQCLRWRHSAAVITRRVLAIIAPQPVTLAASQCIDCTDVYGIVEWRGEDALPGENWVVSHGLCSACAERREAAA